MDSPEIYITFPVKDRESLDSGETDIDFLGGEAILPDGTHKPLSRRGDTQRPLKYIYFSINQDVNVEITLAGDVQYAGLIPAGEFDLNVTFDHIVITASVATRMFLRSSSVPSAIKSGSARLVCRERASVHNVALPAIGANLLAAGITPTNAPATLRIMVAISIVGNFQARITNGGNTQVATFNVVSGPALVAGGLYEFTMRVHAGDSVNFSYSATGGTTQVLRVQERDDATA